MCLSAKHKPIGLYLCGNGANRALGMMLPLCEDHLYVIAIILNSVSTGILQAKLADIFHFSSFTPGSGLNPAI